MVALSTEVTSQNMTKSSYLECVHNMVKIMDSTSITPCIVKIDHDLFVLFCFLFENYLYNSNFAP
jgi:hypothetical protein